MASSKQKRVNFLGIFRMIVSDKIFCAALSAGLLAASVASATTFVFDDVAPNAPLVSFTEGGVTLDVTAGQCSVANPNVCVPITVTQTADGLGASGFNPFGNPDDDTNLDSYPGNEFLLFSFDTLVSLESISFGDLNQPGDDNDEYELYVDLGSGLTEIVDMGTLTPYVLGSGTVTDTILVFAENSDLLVDFRDGFTVSSITLATIPLPATGLLLLAGVGGLGLMRRRSKT